MEAPLFGGSLFDSMSRILVSVTTKWMLVKWLSGGKRIKKEQKQDPDLLLLLV